MNRWLPFWTGLAPILAIHVTYFAAASGGYVPWCFPYIDSCTSISATGREGVGFYLFKGTMLPYAALLAWFWLSAGRWLHAIGDSGRASKVLQTIGTVAAICLAAYVIALGLVGDHFQLLRKIGVVLYFGLTAFCELFLSWRLTRLPIVDRTRPFHLGICTLLLGVGLLSVLLDLTLSDYDTIEDAFEWAMALLTHCYFLILAIAVGQPGFVQAKKRDLERSLRGVPHGEN